jgi:peptidoglycan/xylan/chitin deacetylase (PgdA/CDA1 family)
MWPGGVVSFTFDDFPRSAWLEGGRILEGHGARGTYYAASGLLGSVGPHGRVATSADIRELLQRGHELGCHTRTHLNCAEASREVLLSEVGSNAAELRTALQGRALDSFAFPFGAASPRARRVLRRRFSTLRGIQPGINLGPLDLDALRANRIYDRVFDGDRLAALIEENRSVGGWLIFYTHDICDAPSDHGCTPAQLRDVVAQAASRSQILPVNAVSAAIRPFSRR